LGGGKKKFGDEKKQNEAPPRFPGEGGWCEEKKRKKIRPRPKFGGKKPGEQGTPAGCVNVVGVCQKLKKTGDGAPKIACKKRGVFLKKNDPNFIINTGVGLARTVFGDKKRKNKKKGGGKKSVTDLREHVGGL